MQAGASVVIPARNAATTLPACLRALSGQTAADRLIEVIVVDDGSTDATGQLARAAGAVALHLPGRGAAAARNLGARHARGEILLFTDADCEPAPDWVACMLAPFSDPEIVGVKGTYVTRQRELAARFVQLEYEDRYRRMARLPQIDFIDTYSAGYRRVVFLRYGGFDESFPGANVEDQEFSFRLAAAGQRMVFQPGAVVGHRHAASMRRYLAKKFRIGYWKVKVHVRHPGRVVSDSHTPPALKLQIGALALGIIGLAAIPLWTAGWVLALVASCLFSGSMVPFVLRIWRTDRAVALASPAFLLGRAGALGIGLAMGMAVSAMRWLRSRIRKAV